MQTRAIVPKKPLTISKVIFFPQGSIFFLSITSEVIIKLIIDLKKTNSKMGILSSIFLTHTVIKLKKKDANTKFNLFIKFLFLKNLLSSIIKLLFCEIK